VDIALIFVWVLGVLAYDAWRYTSGRETISARVHRLSKLYPILPFTLGTLVGFLAGHFYG
jgi:uncharacterized membrane protein YfcA